jgi:hypothetical protein
MVQLCAELSFTVCTVYALQFAPASGIVTAVHVGLRCKQGRAFTVALADQKCAEVELMLIYMCQLFCVEIHPAQADV